MGYKAYKEKMTETKEEATGALNRMKMRRVVAVAKLAQEAAKKEEEEAGIGNRRLSTSKEGLKSTSGIRVSQSEGGLRESSKDGANIMPRAEVPAGDEGLTDAEGSPRPSSGAQSPATRGGSALQRAMQARMAATDSMKEEESKAADVTSPTSGGS